MGAGWALARFGNVSILCSSSVSPSRGSSRVVQMPPPKGTLLLHLRSGTVSPPGPGMLSATTAHSEGVTRLIRLRITRWSLHTALRSSPIQQGNRRTSTLTTDGRRSRRGSAP